MKILLTILLLIFQGNSPPNKWSCREGQETIDVKQLIRLKIDEMKKRVTACALPRLPGLVDAQGTVIVEVIVNEEGNVQCARAIYGPPILKTAASDAAMKYKFKPLIIDGKAKPYIGTLALVVSWNTKKMEEQCPRERRA